MPVLETPDRRYVVVHGRLWRRQRPDLAPQHRDRLARGLMDARRAMRAAKRSKDGTALAHARTAVEAAKHGLGERGPVWWTDGAPDLDRRMVGHTPYAGWYGGLQDVRKTEPSRR